MGRLYAFDLAGAAIGAIVVVPLMWIIAVPTLLVALAAVAAVAALLAAEHRRDRLLAIGAIAVSVVAIALAAGTHLYFMPPATASLGPATADRWVRSTASSATGHARDSRSRCLFYDRVFAPVPVHHPGTPLPNWQALHLGPQSIGYALSPHRRVLIIGGGGGRDIDNALTSGEHDVDVIELNRDIVHVVDKDLGPWSGSPYTLPGVHTVTGDGRATLAARSTKYDQIHIGFTDTLSANSAQAFGLTEANLYTVQAYEEYFDHLHADRDPQRLTAAAARRRRGAPRDRARAHCLEGSRHQGILQRNVVVIVGHDVFGALFGTVLARLKPWTPASSPGSGSSPGQRGNGVAYAPGGPYQYEWAQLAAAPSVKSFCTHYRLDVCAPTDNKPFFFNMTRLGDVTAAGRSRVHVFGRSAARPVDHARHSARARGACRSSCRCVPGSRSVRPTSARSSSSPPSVSDFSLLEVVLIQRFVLFLGFPTYALSVVLFSLLLFTGLGAFISSHVRDPKRTLTAVAQHRDRPHRSRRHSGSSRCSPR